MTSSVTRTVVILDVMVRSVGPSVTPLPRSAGYAGAEAAVAVPPPLNATAAAVAATVAADRARRSLFGFRSRPLRWRRKPDMDMFNLFSVFAR
ncbi:hypothetical protein EF910_01145 [Streptomyces sp. WAC07149]|uniref:hypothetical protein n=1 Tax=Streptomyces sp. WAC07149 TaxID=2487425 RepID=UPI000F781711|nr:hypothetical protein [Streptomyces sp. WAC07149]RST08867.1 hypothetical protein EF910_01145 [Streptomyces sp. WAC07149]